MYNLVVAHPYLLTPDLLVQVEDAEPEPLYAPSVIPTHFRILNNSLQVTPWRNYFTERIRITNAYLTAILRTKLERQATKSK